MTNDDRFNVWAECERQHATSPSQLISFEVAYNLIKGARKFCEGPVRVDRGWILALGAMIEPEKNSYMGFRKIPVSFSNGSTAVCPGLIESGIAGALKAYDVNGDAIQFRNQFLYIHPFVDGNGRASNIIWRLMTDTWDRTQPPHYVDPTGVNIHGY